MPRRRHFQHPDLLRRRPRQKGAAVIEFALTFIIFLLLTLGLFEMGRAVWTYTTLAHAARRGVRYASLHGENQPATDDEIAQVVAANLVGLDSSNLGLTVTWTPNRERGSYVQVQLQYGLPLMVSPFVSSERSLPLTSTAGTTVAR